MPRPVNCYVNVQINNLNQQERLTAIRGPTESRHTLVDAALLRAIPKTRVLCLKNEACSPDLTGLFVLLTVEAFPGASGLLCG
jgi:hypothetical protein